MRRRWALSSAALADNVSGLAGALFSNAVSDGFDGMPQS